MASLATFCPSMRDHGNCQNALCQYSHAFLNCDPCGFMCTSAEEMEEHNQSDLHRRRISGQSIIYLCPVCQRRSSGRSMWQQHSRSYKHVKACQAQGIAPGSVEPEEMAEVPNHIFCVACNIHIQTKYWDRHLKKPKHLERESYASFKVILEDSEKDKNSITITGDLDFGVIDLETVSGSNKAQYASISTTDPTARVSLVDIHLSSSKDTTPDHASFTLSHIRANRLITTTSPLSFTVVLHQNYAGRCQDRVELVFEDAHLRTRFVITRPIAAIIGNKADYERLKPSAPYIPRPRTTRQPEIDVVEGERPPAMGAVPYVVPLPKADIPRNLAAALTKGSVAQILTNLKSVFLPREFNSQSYGRHFKYLAWIEEYRAEHDLAIYDMTDIALERHNKFYYLEVPGLAEKRPSVLIGDRILVQAKGAPNGHWFEGRVHFVQQRQVGLVFHRSFSGWTAARLYNVRFKLNRYPIRRQHLALDSPFAEDRVLFPVPGHLSSGPYPKPANNRFRIFNPLIAGNAAQLQAVISITKLQPGAPPFIIFGPPGTGKTVTAVEAIRQILVQSTTARILACAPSNSAADLLALRLRDLGVGTVFRFYAPSRNKDEVPLELRDYTYMRSNPFKDDAPCFSVPILSRMKRFRVVVTTCISASFASGIGLPRGHFSHIFVDEAGQASEPEVMIGIKTMANSDTNIILSGDPKQLGPIIRSPIARQLGLEKSYLERLMEREAYNIQQYYGKSMVKLVRNFRSHGTILKFPNERFYGGELEQCAEKKLINYFLDSSYLPNKNFPVVFHGIRGKDDREASSPSFFNIDEIIQVKRYIQALRSDRHFRTSDQDIGVISPYNAQCRKIRTALRGVADDVKVGSVEEFQGQERKIIIISTVRSSTEFIEYDLKHTLGFVASPRRFNVAITRAQAMLIIVGDPTVLSLDPLWRTFLNYIHRYGGWVGTPITWDPVAPVESDGGYDRRICDGAKLDMNDFTRRIEALTLETMESAEVDNNVDRPWRDVE